MAAGGVLEETEGRPREGGGAQSCPSPTPMEKENKITNPRQTVFAVKAKHLTRDEYRGVVDVLGSLQKQRLQRRSILPSL